MSVYQCSPNFPCYSPPEAFAIFAIFCLRSSLATFIAACSHRRRKNPRSRATLGCPTRCNLVFTAVHAGVHGLFTRCSLLRSRWSPGFSLPAVAARHRCAGTSPTVTHLRDLLLNSCFCRSQSPQENKFSSSQIRKSVLCKGLRFLVLVNNPRIQPLFRGSFTLFSRFIRHLFGPISRRITRAASFALQSFRTFSRREDFFASCDYQLVGVQASACHCLSLPGERPGTVLRPLLYPFPTSRAP